MIKRPLVLGAALLIAIVAASSYAWVKRNPFADRFELSAVFAAENGLNTHNTVIRIAGIDVGRVTRVERTGGDAVVVHMELDRKALPLHTDATAKVRPRLFLEGNWFIDLRPGTPAAKELREGATLPLAQTANPVQFDQILTTFQRDTRTDFQDVFDGFGTALRSLPTAAQDASQDPDVQGKTGAAALNDSLLYSPAAFEQVALTNQAFLGARGDSLSRGLDAFATVAGALTRRQTELRSLWANLRATMGAFARSQGALSSTLTRLPQALRASRTAFTALDGAFPPLRSFAADMTLTARELPATIAAADPWLDQVTPLMAGDELRPLLADLRPMTANLARALAPVGSLLDESGSLGRCTTRVLVPTADNVIEDGPRTSGAPPWHEFVYAITGLGGAGQGFDGNGRMLRGQAGAGATNILSGVSTLFEEPLYGTSLAPPLATRPAMPAREPVHRSDVPCDRNAPPDLDGPAAKTGPSDRIAPPRAQTEAATR